MYEKMRKPSESMNEMYFYEKFGRELKEAERN